jgi:hypothetical protein
VPLVKAPPAHTEAAVGSDASVSDPVAPSLTSAVRSLPERFRSIVDRSDDPADLGRRPWMDAATAMEHLLCVGDLLHRAGDRLEQLVADARPLKGQLNRYERVAGYHAWDPEMVLTVFRSEAERVARSGRELAGDKRLPVACRRGLALIAADLVDRLVQESDKHLVEAEHAVAASASGTAGERRAGSAL